MKVVENHGIVKPQYKLTLYHSTANYLYMRVAVGREPNYMAPATESFMSTHFLSWRQKLTTEISDWISNECSRQGVSGFSEVVFKKGLFLG